MFSQGKHGVHQVILLCKKSGQPCIKNNFHCCFPNENPIYLLSLILNIH